MKENVTNKVHLLYNLELKRMFFLKQSFMKDPDTWDCSRYHNLIRLN